MHHGLPTETLRDLKCVKCGPDAKDCDDLVLGAKCHTQAGVDVSAHANLVGIRCHQCHKRVMDLEALRAIDVSGVPLHEHHPTCACGEPIHIVEPRCHPDGPVEVLYRKGSHSLDIRCKTCRTISGSIQLDAMN